MGEETSEVRNKSITSSIVLPLVTKIKFLFTSVTNVGS